MSESYKFHIKNNFKLALPVALGNMMHMTTALADTIMVARVGVTELAAVGFSNAVFMFPFLIGTGLSAGITASVGKANGASDRDKCESLFFSSIWTSLIAGAGLTIILLILAYFLGNMGQEKIVAETSFNYFLILTASMPIYMVFLALKNFIEGLQSTAPGMIIIIISNIINIGLNYLLIFGKYGFPELGLEGAGWATLIARSTMLIFAIIAFVLFKRFKKYVNLTKIKYNSAEVNQIFKLGLPIGFQVAFEVGIFSMGTIIAGWIDRVDQAAHKIALDISAFTYLIASGLGTSSTISVSHYFGKNDFENMRKSAHAALALTLFYMSITCLIFLFTNSILPLAFTENEQVISIAASLLIIAAFFQISDGLQVTTLGILRGMHDVKIPTYVTLVSYWLIGIPVAYLLAIYYEIGPEGIWYGYLTGLSLVAITMFIRFEKLSKKMIKEKT